MTPFTWYVSTFLFATSLSISLLCTSMTISKRMRDKWSHCLIPLKFLKGGVGVPSTSTKKDAEEKGDTIPDQPM